MWRVEATVWMVRLRHKDVEEHKGRMQLAADALVFTERGGAEYVIPLASIHKTKRVRGSPVMIVRHGTTEQLETAFYFAQPPPLHQKEDAGATTLAMPRLGIPLRGRGGRPGKRKSMRTNAQYLTTANASWRDQIEGWVRAIEKARAAG
jgi:hypothetical protein